MVGCNGAVRGVACETRKLKEYNKTLKGKCQKLICEKQDMEKQIEELKYCLNDIQAINDAMRDDIESAVAAECGCIVIDGAKYSAAYQDMVGSLLSNGYSVELMPVDRGRKLKVTIKESEEE